MENDHALNVQNAFFNQVRKDRTRVSVQLNSGQRIVGVLKSFDRYTLLLDTRHGEQVVFKHAVSTVSLQREGEEAARGERKGAGERRRSEDRRPPDERAPAEEHRGAKFGNFIDMSGIETKKE